MSSLEDDKYLEWYVEDTFVKEMEEAGWLTLKGDKIKRGFPDRFCFGPDKQVVIIEFKRSAARKRKGEKLQDYYRDQFENFGFEVYKITGMREADELREKLLAKGAST